MTTTPTHNLPSGADIESALDIIGENGGTGEWEQGSDAPEVERWLFPRFAGATDPADMYLSRVGTGPHDTDVETIVAWLEAPRNIVGAILLEGEPGTGKTALLEAGVTHAEKELTTHVCSPDDTRDSLFLRFVGENKGECITFGHNHEPGVDDHDDTCVRSPYTLGPIPFAAKYGRVLYCDEVLLLQDGVKPVLYPLSDNRHTLPGGNVDGTDMEIHPDFRLVLSSNPQVRGASLPEPLGSRCAGTTLHVETSAPMLTALGIDESIVAAWSALGTQGLWRPQVREMRVADYWLPVDVAQAVSAFVPEHCPASQREAVRDTVVSFLGGDIRGDGRLVVK